MVMNPVSFFLKIITSYLSYHKKLGIRILLKIVRNHFDDILVIRSGKSLISRYYYVADSFLILRCSSSEVDALHIRNMPQDSVERILDGIEMVRRGLKFPLCLLKLGG